ASGAPLVPLALAAYVAYLLHAAVDWDWEMGAVTLTALFVAAVLLASAADREDALALSPVARAVGAGATLLLAVVAFVGVVGASALSASDTALTKGRYGVAHSQAEKAADWWRWSPDPWTQLGDIAAAQG